LQAAVSSELDKINRPYAPTGAVQADFSFDERHPPVAATAGGERLLVTLSAISLALGGGPMRAADISSHGAADTSFAAPHVEAVLDGLGPSRGPSAEDHVSTDALVAAVERATLLVYRIAGPNADAARK
jgi:glutamate carboxypeptidase